MLHFCCIFGKKAVFLQPITSANGGLPSYGYFLAQFSALMNLGANIIQFCKQTMICFTNMYSFNDN